MTKLEILEKLNKERTQGPWFSDPNTHFPSVRVHSGVRAGTKFRICKLGEPCENEHTNAEFIAAAANSMAALLAVAQAANDHISVYGVRTLTDQHMADALAELEKL
jgi:hypothetical protein